MSIKNAIKRLENQVAKSRNSHSFTCVIPYCQDEQKTRELQQSIIKENGLESGDILVVFVIDYAKAA
jgi:hypothetical protein